VCAHRPTQRTCLFSTTPRHGPPSDSQQLSPPPAAQPNPCCVNVHRCGVGRPDRSCDAPSMCAPIPGAVTCRERPPTAPPPTHKQSLNDGGGVHTYQGEGKSGRYRRATAASICCQACGGWRSGRVSWSSPSAQPRGPGGCLLWPPVKASASRGRKRHDTRTFVDGSIEVTLLGQYSDPPPTTLNGRPVACWWLMKKTKEREWVGAETRPHHSKPRPTDRGPTAQPACTAFTKVLFSRSPRTCARPTVKQAVPCDEGWGGGYYIRDTFPSTKDGVNLRPQIRHPCVLWCVWWWTCEYGCVRLVTKEHACRMRLAAAGQGRRRGQGSMGINKP
jgi:hypothetical protein